MTTSETCRYLGVTFSVGLVGIVVAAVAVLGIVIRFHVHNPILIWALMGVVIAALVRPMDYVWRRLV